MDTITLAAALLDCGTLDAEYLLRLIDTHDLDLVDLLDDVAGYRGSSKPHVNDLIGAGFERIAQTFLTRVVKRRICRFRSAEYTVWTNCLDS